MHAHLEQHANGEWHEEEKGEEGVHRRVAKLGGLEGEGDGGEECEEDLQLRHESEPVLES